MGASHYSDTESEAIRKHFEAGLSASQIAAALYSEIGIAHTRNAIVGKLWRLGLRRGCRDNPQMEITNGVLHRKRKPRAKQAKAHKKSNGFRNRSKPIPPTIILPETEEAEAIPFAQRRQVGELTNETCRWGFNDPCKADFFFCGAPEADLAKGKPYCAFHMSRSIDQSQLPF